MPMGHTEAGTTSKIEKAPSPVQEQGQTTNIHAYPDWAAIQAYYGHGVGLPPPYFSSAVTSGHAPHPYLWGPQPMMPPYGTPYAAIYPHGGVYAHPSVAIGAHAHGHGITSSGTSDNVVASHLSIETPAKSSGNKGQGLMKKLKGFDGLAVSMGSGSAENAAGGGAVRGLSQSEECGTGDSSDGSDGNTALRGNQPKGKRSCKEMTVKGKDESVDTRANNTHGGEANGSSRPMEELVAAASVIGKPVGTIPLPSMAPGMEFKGSAGPKAKSSAVPIPAAATGVVPAHDGVPSELWVQDERELKRERRKQSNRESARRSRFRKQVETEELATKVESLNEENVALKAEIDRITENLEKLRQEHSTLKEKLKDAQIVKAREVDMDKLEAQGGPPVGIENLLSRVNNSSLMSRSMQRESEARENSGGKLHQLLESNSRADAVAAS